MRKRVVVFVILLADIYRRTIRNSGEGTTLYKKVIK
jgi:hypothetical protein